MIFFLRWFLILVGAALAAIVIFQQFADPLFLVGGTRPVAFYQVARSAAIAAIVLFLVVLAFVEAGFPRSALKRVMLLAITTLILLLTTHRVVDEVTRGKVTDEWALLPIQHLNYPIADGPAPVYRAGLLITRIETPEGAISVFRGIPLWTVNFPVQQSR